LLKNPHITYWLRLETCVQSITIRAHAAGALHSFTIENRMTAAKTTKARGLVRIATIIHCQSGTGCGGWPQLSMMFLSTQLYSCAGKVRAHPPVHDYP